MDMTQELKLIRGKRILQQLDETTFQKLEQNVEIFEPESSFRQHVIDNVHISNLELIPARQSGDLKVEAVARSNGKTYNPVILFLDVKYQEADQANNVSFVGSDKNEYNIRSIQFEKSNVKVGCDCLDFRWRFAMYNNKDGSLYGNPPPPYKRKTNRPPVNEKRIPGVCKHLLATMLELITNGMAG